MLKVSDVDAINKILDDLDVQRYNRITIEDLSDESQPSDTFIAICTALLEKLHVHDSKVEILLGDVTVIAIYKAIECRLPHFLETACMIKYRLISFICSHLQVRTKI